SARLAKLNRFGSLQIVTPDARKVSRLCRWPTTPLRRKQSRNSMEKKSADATSLSTKHGRCKKETTTAVAGDDIETVNRVLVPLPKKEICDSFQNANPDKRVWRGSFNSYHLVYLTRDVPVT